MSHTLTQDSDFLNDIFDSADHGIAVHDTKGKIIFCNPAAERILHLSQDNIQDKYSRDFEPATYREDGTPFPAAEHPASITLRSGKPCTNIVMGLEWRPGAAWTWLNISTSIIPTTKRGAGRVVAMFTDITPHIEAKRQLREVMISLKQKNRALTMVQSFMHGLINTIPDMIWLKDPNGTYIFCNAALAKNYGVTELEVIGKTDYDFWPPAQADAFRRTDLEARQGRKTIRFDISPATGNGRRATMESVRVPIHDASGEVRGILGISRDVTEHMELQRQLRQANSELKTLAEEQLLLARTDALTGLANRRAFEEAIDPAFQRRTRRNAVTSLLVIDIDHFKHVNDKFGHEAGDAALIALANALRANRRAQDLPARLGGDEFALLLPNTNPKDATTLAGRLREDIGHTEISCGKLRFKVSISIGIAAFRERDLEWSAAIKRADKALYKAKSCTRTHLN